MLKSVLPLSSAYFMNPWIPYNKEMNNRHPQVSSALNLGTGHLIWARGGGGGPGSKVGGGGLWKISGTRRGVYEILLGYEGGSMKKTMTKAAGGSMKNKWMTSARGSMKILWTVKGGPQKFWIWGRGSMKKNRPVKNFVLGLPPCWY